jgi:hypothetical protein
MAQGGGATQPRAVNCSTMKLKRTTRTTRTTRTRTTEQWPELCSAIHTIALVENLTILL